MKISDVLKTKIMNSLIEPHYYGDVERILRDIKYWQIVETIFEVVSKLLVCFGGVLSFGSGYFNSTILSFVSGATSTVSLATFQYAIYCSKRMKKDIIKLNEILKSLNIAPIVEPITTPENSQVEKLNANMLSPNNEKKISPENVNNV